VGEGQGEGMLREPLPLCCALTPALSRTREREQNSSPYKGITDFVRQNSLEAVNSACVGWAVPTLHFFSQDKACVGWALPTLHFLDMFL
jgi:hypothetical protein